MPDLTIRIGHFLFFIFSMACAGQFPEKTASAALSASGEEKQAEDADSSKNEDDGGNTAPGGTAAAVGSRWLYDLCCTHRGCGIPIVSGGGCYACRSRLNRGGFLNGSPKCGA